LIFGEPGLILEAGWPAPWSDHKLELIMDRGSVDVPADGGQKDYPFP